MGLNANNAIVLSATNYFSASNDQAYVSGVIVEYTQKGWFALVNGQANTPVEIHVLYKPIN